MIQLCFLHNRYTCLHLVFRQCASHAMYIIHIPNTYNTETNSAFDNVLRIVGRADLRISQTKEFCIIHDTLCVSSLLVCALSLPTSCLSGWYRSATCTQQPPEGVLICIPPQALSLLIINNLSAAFEMRSQQILMMKDLLKL